MRTLVTGGAGFIGSNLVDALIGPWRRRARRRRPVEWSPGKPRGGDRARGRRSSRRTSATAGAVAAAFDRHRPELVFHLAAQIDVRRSVEDPAYDLGLNVGGTINLLEAARRSGNASRFVFASTGGAIYGEGADRELPLRRGRGAPPRRTVRPEQAGCRGLPEPLQRPPRPVDHGRPAPRQRLRAAAGPARARPAWSRSSRARCSTAAPHACSATVARPATTSTSATSYRPSSPRRTAMPPARYNVGTGVETDVLELGAIIAGLCGTTFEPEMAPARAGEVQRIAIDSCARPRGARLAGRIHPGSGARGDRVRRFARRRARRRSARPSAGGSRTGTRRSPGGSGSERFSEASRRWRSIRASGSSVSSSAYWSAAASTSRESWLPGMFSTKLTTAIPSA